MSAEAPKQVPLTDEIKKIAGPANPPPADAAARKWPELDAEHPLSKLSLKLPDLIAQSTHGEIYGIDVNPSSPSSDTFLRSLILQKFLRANSNDVDKAAEQLLATLKWRKEFNPLAARDAAFSAEKFGGLGYVTRVDGVPNSKNKSDVATFNIYGAVSDNKATFGDTEAFLRWRVALMEMSIAALDLSSATQPIPDFGQGPDPYQGLQIHDYLNVSFLRQDPHVKAASKEAINTFSKFYPETLSRKFFVNVPVIMGWMFGAMKMVLSAETTKKFTVVTYAKDLAADLGPGCPEQYGGKGGKLAEVSQTTKTT